MSGREGGGVKEAAQMIECALIELHHEIPLVLF